MSTDATTATTHRAGFTAARLIYYLTLILFLTTVTVGLGWDRLWHTTHRFETFFSPPHLFIYTLSVISTLLTAAIIAIPSLQRWFGAAIRLPLLPLEIPGALLFLFGAFCLQGFAGLVLDNFWHTRFGLDETGWSFPHAMLGWAFFLTILGFAACRLAYRDLRPIRWYHATAFGFLIIAASAAPFLGPLYRHHTPETVRAIASLPALLEQPQAQHTYRIYLQWNLTRTNPLFLLLSPLWAGTALALVRSLDRRARVYLVTVALWAFSALVNELRTAGGLERYLNLGRELIRHPANWLPAPLLGAMLVFALLTLVRLGERWSWGAAGLAYGVLAWLIYQPGLLWLPLVLLASGGMAGGSLLGDGIYRLLEAPTRWLRLMPFPLAGVGVPFVTGLVDLFLRRVTP